MKVNTSAWVISIVAGSVICVVLGASRAKDQSPQDKALALEQKERKDGLSLAEHAELAKLKGRSSVLAINDDGTLETLDNRPHRIKREVDERYNNSIDQLMTALRKNKDGNRKPLDHKV